MRLRRLAIRSLPGIEPGFDFEPPGAGVNLVTGPNAVGKSSLVRALAYLLASERSDPPALSLEAEFEGEDARWRVQRNGSQILWRRNGEVAPRPALPAADQIGRYRLSIENLLDDDDASDRELAGRLRRELHGNFDLGALRPEIGARFARRGANALDDARRERRGVERDYAALGRQEAELPGLERRIAAARAAEERCSHLKRALQLMDAVEVRRRCEETLEAHPPEMERLRGDELERLERAEQQRQALREDLQERRRARAEAETALEGTGLAQERPAPELVQTLAAKLRTLDQLRAERRNTREGLARAEAALRDTLGSFNDAGEAPRLDARVFRRIEDLAPRLVSARTRRQELREQLSLAGNPPDESEIDRYREGAEALRAWLAADASDPGPGRVGARATRIAAWAALVVAALVALAAVLQGAVFVLAGALAALIASAGILILRRGSRGVTPSPGDGAERRFADTGVEAPPRWETDAVRRHLRESVEARLSELVLERQRAAGRDRLARQVEEAEARCEELEKERRALATECAFDPDLPVAAFHRFVHLCSRLDESRARRAEQQAALALLDAEISDTSKQVRDALAPWGAGGDPKPEGAAEQSDPDRLHSACDRLKERIRAADDALAEVRHCDTAIDSLNRRIAELDQDLEYLFDQAGLEPGAQAELDRRVNEGLPRWKEARAVLDKASAEERVIRDALAEQPDLVALANEGRRAELEGELEGLSGRAGEHTSLIEQRTEIQTRLQDTGKDSRLERAAARESAAEQALSDKREEALLAVATATLLDDLEEEFVSEHEPAVLRAAREIFAQVTAHAFDLKLRRDGAFMARDLRQGETRELSELSSGTRAQLLLALRLAWTEAQERGGESLPLFLDEALTTSDEDRFAVMARSLERIATAEGRPRQVFYLSARRHEGALWKRATGTEPATVDLASLRFHGQAAAPEDYRVEDAPPLPAPEGHSPESYARLLEVPALDPRRPEGSVHPFHLLRDELPLLHALMDTWRIRSLGQLEALLASDAAPAALADEEVRTRLRGRCRALRTWVDLWRQGRGRPVDRGVLEQCGAVSAVFIDRAAELADRLKGDGEAFLRALRDGALGHFRSSKVAELEGELIEEGCIDLRERLDGEERRRLTLQRTASQGPVDAGDLGRVVGWLESAAGGGGTRAPAESQRTSRVETS